MSGRRRFSLARRAAGFTLLEIMVALAVLALSGIALLTNVNQATSQLGRLNDKLVALNVAEYALNTALLQKDFPELGTDEEIVTLADREWRVEITVSETPNEQVRRIDTLVTPYEPGRTLSGEAESSTILLSGFRADLD